MDLDIFFPKKGGKTAAAIATCGRCPVKADCLEEAMSIPAHKLKGIWAGTSQRERIRTMYGNL